MGILEQLESISIIAKESGVGEATITRFTKK